MLDYEYGYLYLYLLTSISSRKLPSLKEHDHTDFCVKKQEKILIINRHTYEHHHQHVKVLMEYVPVDILYHTETELCHKLLCKTISKMH